MFLTATQNALAVQFHLGRPHSLDFEELCLRPGARQDYLVQHLVAEYAEGRLANILRLGQAVGFQRSVQGHGSQACALTTGPGAGFEIGRLRLSWHFFSTFRIPTFLL